MAKATEKAAETAARNETQVGPQFGAMDYQALIDANGENMQAFMKAGEAWLQGMADLNNEMMTFANRRLQEQAETRESLTQCKDLETAYRVNCDFAQKATQVYLEEATKLMSMAAELARQSMAPFETRTRETLRRLNGD